MLFAFDTVILVFNHVPKGIKILRVELESLNYRMDDIRRDLWRLSSLTPSSKESQLVQINQDYIQFGFEYLHHLSGQPVPVFDHSHYKSFFFFLIRFKQLFLCFNLCPLPPVQSGGTNENSLPPTSSFPPRYLCTLISSS